MKSLIHDRFNSKSSEDSKWQKNAAQAETEVRTKMIRRKRSVNVLVVGLPRAGKSSLIASLQCCLVQNGNRHIYSYENGATNTVDSSYERIPEFIPNNWWSLRKNVLAKGDMDDELYTNAPRLYDLPGLLKSDDRDVVKTVLNHVVDGRVPVGETFPLSNKVDFSSQFCEPQNEVKIDRVVIVHSCLDRLSEKLVDIVNSICRDKDIVVFSVLTHTDVPVKNHFCTEESLGLAVGTHGSLRAFSVELPHSASSGQCENIARTEFFLWLLWKALINPNYPIHSERG